MTSDAERPAVGIEVQGTSVRDMGRSAQEADRAGLASAWAPELYNRSATITLAEMAQKTERCTIGSAITYAVGRSPMTLAAEARDLDELADGRLILGIGNGTRRMISDWHGQDPDAPAVRVEELVPLLRRLWRMHEGPVQHEGRFYRLDFRPTGEVDPPLRDRIPVYTAGVNPRMVEAAGRVADGLLGHPLFSPAYLEEVVHPAIGRGAAKTDRDPAAVTVACLVIAVIHADAEQARREAAAMLAFYASVKSYAGVLDFAGFGAEAEAIREAFGRHDPAAMLAAVSDRMVDELALAGTAADVRSQARRFDGILDHLILYAPGYDVSPERVHENALSLIGAFGSAAAADG